MAGKKLEGAESQRLEEDALRQANWKRWGPYLSERQWATVREDYSPDGQSWTHFSHDHARSRAYRWGEDGLLGITDRECRLCFAAALWNTQDPFLKERLFGLTGPQGNHGEDVKECYYYLDATPTHSYMRALYQYPQGRFPYEALVEENRRRSRQEPEYELTDTGVFADHRYFDVAVEYAKRGPNDLLIAITAVNRGPEKAVLHLLPTLWFRNTWIWGCAHEGCWMKPLIRLAEDDTLATEHVTLGRFHFAADRASDGTGRQWLFTDNLTNTERLYGAANASPYVKDAFDRYVVEGEAAAVNPRHFGTKAAAHYRLEIAAGAEVQVRLRLWAETEAPAEPFGDGFQQVLAARRQESDEFYAQVIPAELGPEERLVARQAYAGLLWSKQFFHYVVEDWLTGDPNLPPPPESRKGGRNADWRHLFNRDVLSVPDKWEYPWYAAWDLAFHMIPFARLDPAFAKEQLTLLLREWYMHPNGQIPAYEFDFGGVNPPVHAWACWRVYKMTGPRGQRDWRFLSAAFQKLLINFTWWVNRKDARGKHLFSGGFLGLDNIGVFDRSRPLPRGGVLEQADGTAWMAFYCTVMLAMAIELSRFDPAAEDVASKFFEHFVYIADAINTIGGTGLWNEDDGFYYDQMHVDGRRIPLRVRSIVGLIPLLTVEVLSDELIGGLHGFQKRLDWFLTYRQDLARHISYMETQDGHASRGRRLLAIPCRPRLERVLRYVLDENEFLSPYGIRSLSKYHRDNPYVFRCSGQEYRVEYLPGESDSNFFGGNSNWRGPIWFPLNYLLIEALERYHYFYGDSLKVECPTGSGRWMNLAEVAHELSSRLVKLFLPDQESRRPCRGGTPRAALGPDCDGLLLFHEYFHGETGAGLGASHQTGWTSLVADCLWKMARGRAT
ncbi:MAG: MGH1-like glycoside hydrolase domain-containing protein [Thermoguttaceae bacterium]